MPKSKIIIDIVNSDLDLNIALKRVKVLLMGLNSPEINNWVESELTGYKTDAHIPSYRIIKSKIYGNFTFNQYHYRNFNLNSLSMDLDTLDKIETTTLYDGIQILKTSYSPEKIVPLEKDCYDLIKKSRKIESNSLYWYKLIDNKSIENIFLNVESKLIDILSILEKKFGCLDEYDINYDEKNDNEIEDTRKIIYQIIYNDSSVKIGDNNTIKNSDISIN